MVFYGADNSCLVVEFNMVPLYAGYFTHVLQMPANAAGAVPCERLRISFHRFKLGTQLMR